MAAFEFKLTLAEVDFADETECRYNLDVPGAQVAMLIYRIHPVTMYEMYKDSSQKTANLPNLGDEAILLGNAHIEVKLDKERALEVSLSIDNTSGGLSMTPEKVTERLTHFAYLLHNCKHLARHHEKENGVILISLNFEELCAGIPAVWIEDDLIDLDSVWSQSLL